MGFGWGIDTYIEAFYIGACSLKIAIWGNPSSEVISCANLITKGSMINQVAKSVDLPFGELTLCHGKSPFFMGSIFNSYLSLPGGGFKLHRNKEELKLLGCCVLNRAN